MITPFLGATVPCLSSGVSSAQLFSLLLLGRGFAFLVLLPDVSCLGAIFCRRATPAAAGGGFRSPRLARCAKETLTPGRNTPDWIHADAATPDEPFSLYIYFSNMTDIQATGNVSASA